jgi:hypothetical protein
VVVVCVETSGSLVGALVEVVSVVASGVEISVVDSFLVAAFVVGLCVETSASVNPRIM